MEGLFLRVGCFDPAQYERQHGVSQKGGPVFGSYSLLN